MAIKTVQFTSEYDGADFKLQESKTGNEYNTTVYIKPTGFKNARWYKVTSFKLSAYKIKQDIKYQIGAYLTIQNHIDHEF